MANQGNIFYSLLNEQREEYLEAENTAQAEWAFDQGVACLMSQFGEFLPVGVALFWVTAVFNEANLAWSSSINMNTIDYPEFDLQILVETICPN